MAHYYACPCLNVKICGSPFPSSSTDASQFQRVDVGEHGVQITHSDLTLRSRAFSGQGTDRARYTTLTCLLCNTIAYRVPAETIGEELPEGPIVGRDGEWVIPETLGNKDGWVEVASTCKSGDAYHQAVSSPTYSPVFSVVLPQKNLTSPTTKPPPASDSLSFTIPPLTSSLPPLFLAPPFTPSHTVFHSFSKHAIKSSDELRKRVEQELESFVTAKIHDLAAAERELKRDVDYLWRKWKDAWKMINGVNADNPELVKRESAHNVPTIKDFVPQRPPVPASDHRPSSEIKTQVLPKDVASLSLLSASLAATSSIHQHMRHSPDSTSSAQRVTSLSPPSGSPTLATLPSPATGSIAIAAFSRKVDESVAIAASLKIAMEDEAAMAATVAAYREKTSQKAERSTAHEDRGESSSSQDPARGRTPPSSSKRVQFAPSIREEDEEPEYAIVDEHDTREPELFDFEPIPRSAAAIDDTTETSITPISSPRRSALRLAEATEATGVGAASTPPPKPETSSAVLQSATSTLPISPPRKIDPTESKIREIMAAEAPSHRAAWKKHDNAYSMFAEDVKQKGKMAEGRGSVDDEEEWEGGSDLSDKSDKRSQGVMDMARSLPINIGPISGLPKGDPRIPKSSLADRPNVLVPPLRRSSSGASSGHPRVSSSVATRERAYMARDISRSMDPGHSLDLGDRIAEEDEDGSVEEATEEPFINILEAAAESSKPPPPTVEPREFEKEDLGTQSGGDETERSRQRALRILQRSQDHAPDAGMWRSVAE